MVYEKFTQVLKKKYGAAAVIDITYMRIKSSDVIKMGFATVVVDGDVVTLQYNATKECWE